MAQPPNRYNCPLDATMSIIEGRWKCTIICILAKNGPLRFSELQKRIGPITSRILSKQLKELEEDQMVSREEDSEGRVKVTYSLAPRGRSILPVLSHMAAWGLENRFTQVITEDDVVSRR